ncbi:MAG: putative cation transport regulator ChaB [Gemmatimonadota bacterium]
MPYERNHDLPDSVRDNLPEHAQTMYRAAFNSAWSEYASPAQRRDDDSQEETAHRVAWSAVKHEYEKGESGKWHRKS